MLESDESFASFFLLFAKSDRLLPHLYTLLFVLHIHNTQPQSQVAWGVRLLEYIKRMDLRSQTPRVAILLIFIIQFGDTNAFMNEKWVSLKLPHPN